MSAPPSGNNTQKWLAIGCAIVLLLCICLFIGIAATGALGGLLASVVGTQPAADAGDAFMTALKNGDYNKAYALCSTDAQSQLVNAQGLQRIIEGSQVRPSKWSFSSRNVSNNQAQLEGSATMTAGEGTVSLSLVQVGEQWKVDAFHLQAR